MKMNCGDMKCEKREGGVAVSGGSTVLTNNFASMLIHFCITVSFCIGSYPVWTFLYNNQIGYPAFNTDTMTSVIIAPLMMLSFAFCGYRFLDPNVPRYYLSTLLLPLYILLIFLMLYSYGPEGASEPISAYAVSIVNLGPFSLFGPPLMLLLGMLIRRRVNQKRGVEIPM